MAKLLQMTPADPFSFDRLYGQEKYSLDNMELTRANFPDHSEFAESVWWDRNREEWNAASPVLDSHTGGDAYFSGVSSEALLKFAQALADRIGFKHTVTGARVVRFTHGMSGYPVLRLDMTAGKCKNDLRSFKNGRIRGQYDYGNDEY